MQQVHARHLLQAGEVVQLAGLREGVYKVLARHSDLASGLGEC